MKLFGFRNSWNSAAFIMSILCVYSIAADPVWVSVGINKISAENKDRNTKLEYIITLKTEAGNQLFKRVIVDQPTYKAMQDLLIPQNGFAFEFSFGFNDSIYNKVTAKISQMQPGVVKDNLEKALDDFKKYINTNIMRYCMSQPEEVRQQNNDVKSLREAIEKLNFERGAITKETIENHIKNIEEVLVKIKRFTLPIDLFDNKAEFVMPYRTLYLEIEKLGKAFGFTCAPIDSTWSQYAWKNKWIFLGIGGIGVAAMMYRMNMFKWPSISMPLSSNSQPLQPAEPQPVQTGSIIKKMPRPIQ